jgi:simple sugar transport system substrate-binding protein
MAAHDMRPWRIRGIVAATVLAALTLAGCSTAGDGDGSGEGEKIRVGAIYLDSQGYYGGVKAGVQAAADASGLDVDFLETNPGGDVAKESEFMNTLVSSGVSAIIISAASSDASVPAIKQAFEAGIPVICYNTCVNDDAIDKYVTAYIIGDPVSFGQQLGEAAAQYFTDAGIDTPRSASSTVSSTRCASSAFRVQRRSDRGAAEHRDRRESGGRGGRQRGAGRRADADGEPDHQRALR